MNYYEDYKNKFLSYPNLTSDEENELWKKVEDGDEGAKKKIIFSYSKNVISIVETNIESGLSAMELLNEGNIGLLKAVENYDITKEYNFSDYCNWWIRQSINRAIQDFKKLVRTPTNDYISPTLKIRKVKRNLSKKLNREPSIKEIAIESNISEEVVKKLLTYNHID